MLNEIIKLIRKEKEISQNSLAKKTGINRSTLSRFESGEKDLSEKTKIKTLKAMGFSDRTIFKVLVLVEFFRLRDQFNDKSVESQIRKTLSYFKEGSDGERILYDFFYEKMK